jgi:hypothetical protein
MTIMTARLSHAVKLARRLCGDTTMTLPCNAERVQMNRWSHVSNLLHAKH